MLMKELREQVLEANLELVRRGLVLYTFGNASGVDREQELVVIKNSGVDYDKIKTCAQPIDKCSGLLKTKHFTAVKPGSRFTGWQENQIGCGVSPDRLLQGSNTGDHVNNADRCAWSQAT